MKPIVSILVPSRNRNVRLLLLLESIEKSSKNPNYEILVRFHLSDTLSNLVAPILKERFGENLSIIYGGDLNGHDSLGEFYKQLADYSNGDWLWLLNDDMTVSGDWLSDISKVPRDGKWLPQPSKVINGGSEYFHWHDGPAPFVAGDTTDFGPRGEVDTYLYKKLVEKEGRKVWYLPNTVVNHQRRIDATLPKERF